MYFVFGRYAVQPLSAADVAVSCGITGGSMLSANGTAAFSIIRTVAGVVTPGTVSGIVVVPPTPLSSGTTASPKVLLPTR
jgi:hypothetical protein